MARKHGGRKWTNVQQRKAVMAKYRENQQAKKKQREVYPPLAPSTPAQEQKVVDWLKKQSVVDQDKDKTKQQISKIRAAWGIQSKSLPKKKKRPRGQHGSAKPTITQYPDVEKAKKLGSKGMISRIYRTAETGGYEGPTTRETLEAKMKKYGLEYDSWKTLDQNERALFVAQLAKQSEKMHQKTGKSMQELVERKFARFDYVPVSQAITREREKEWSRVDNLTKFIDYLHKASAEPVTSPSFLSRLNLKIQRRGLPKEIIKAGWRPLSPREEVERDERIRLHLPIPPLLVPERQLRQEARLQKTLRESPLESQRELAKDIMKYRGLPPTETERREKKGHFVIPPVQKAVDYATLDVHDVVPSGSKLYGADRIAVRDASSIPSYERRLMSIPYAEIGTTGSTPRPLGKKFSIYGGQRIVNEALRPKPPKDPKKDDKKGTKKEPKSDSNTWYGDYAMDNPFYSQELARYIKAGGIVPLEAQGPMTDREKIDAINLHLRKKYQAEGRLERFIENPWEETARPTPGLSTERPLTSITSAPQKRDTGKYKIVSAFGQEVTLPVREIIQPAFDDPEKIIAHKGYRFFIDSTGYANPWDEPHDVKTKSIRHVRLAMEKNPMNGEAMIGGHPDLRIAGRLPPDIAEIKKELEEQLYQQGQIDTKPGQHPSVALTERERTNLAKKSTDIPKIVTMDDLLSQVAKQEVDNPSLTLAYKARLRSLAKERKGLEKERKRQDQIQERVIRMVRKQQHTEWIKQKKEQDKWKEKPLWSRFLHKLSIA